MAWILVPLPYLFFIWRAKRRIAKAEAAAGKRSHKAHLDKALDAVMACEAMQLQFPEVTNWIDIRRTSQALRDEMSE